MDRHHSRVLVVDDLADAADSMAMLLNLCGYESEAHHSGEAALASARLHRPAIVVLDLQMPGMNGFEFVRQLREVEGCTQTGIVIVSGNTASTCRAHARDIGIGHYLFKPVELNSLLKVMDELLDQQHALPVRRKNVTECANDGCIWHFIWGMQS